MDGAAEEVVVLLAGDPDQGGEAVGLHAVPALLPLHRGALRLNVNAPVATKCYMWIDMESNGKLCL